MKISDFKGFFRKSYLEVISIENPYDDYYLITLKIDDNYKWLPGEHASFSLPDRKVEGKKWRAFSIASINQEGFLLIATRTGKKASSFKENLISMKAGERVGVRGPFGWFKITDNKSPMVLFASGVGITPIRAFLKELQNDTDRIINVIYASSDFYLFEDEIKSIVENNDNINLIQTKDRTTTQDNIKELGLKYGNGAFYYISGSMPVINSTKDLLTSVNINSKQIINDPFLGY